MPDEPVDIARLQRNVKFECDYERLPRREDMVIPNHLLCMITGEVMKHPVMIESGQSYERDAIIRYFEIQKQRAESDKHDMGEDFDDNEYRSYFKCPAT